jgi:hypothetical protein
VRIAFVADIHAGNHQRHGGAVEAGLNARCRAVVDALMRAVDRARELQCGALAVLGDLFDSASPSPQVIAAVQQALRGVETYLLLGNHDMVSMAPGDHALGPLDGFNMIEVVERPTVISVGDAELWTVPFQPGDARKWLPKTLATSFQNIQPPKHRILCLHLGLIDESTPPYLKDAHDAVPVSLVEELKAHYGIDCVLAGNWHSRKRWGNVMQVGALVPTGWDNPGLTGYGSLVIYDSADKTLTVREIPGPRFIKARMPEDVDAAIEGAPEGTQLYLQYVAPPDQLDEARKLVDSLGMVFTAAEVIPDGAAAESAARGAADAARSTETLIEALNAFVKEMPLDEGVDRELVLLRAREYLWATPSEET